MHALRQRDDFKQRFGGGAQPEPVLEPEKPWRRAKQREAASASAATDASAARG